MLNAGTYHLPGGIRDWLGEMHNQCTESLANLDLQPSSRLQATNEMDFRYKPYSNTDVVGFGKREDERWCPSTEDSVKITETISNLPDSVRQVAAGSIHCVASTSDGKVYSWGEGEKGAMGRDGDNKAIPQEVSGFITSEGVCDDNLITQIEAGDCYSCFLSIRGHVFFTGTFRDAYHAFQMAPLGLRSYGDKVVSFARKPIHLVLPEGAGKVVRIYGGSQANILAIQTNDHQLYTLGAGLDGQLGWTETEADHDQGNMVPIDRFLDAAKNIDHKYAHWFLSPKPAIFSECGLYHVMHVACGAKHMLVVAKRDGKDPRVYGCGSNNHLQLGLPVEGPNSNATMRYHKLTVITELQDKTAYQVAAGCFHSMVLMTENGTTSINQVKQSLYAFGWNESGQLGIGFDTNRQLPTSVKFPDEVTIKSIFCGSDHSGAITENGHLYMWGKDDGDHQTGLVLDPVDQSVYSPKRVYCDRLSGNSKALQASCGSDFTLSLWQTPSS